MALLLQQRLLLSRLRSLAVASPGVVGSLSSKRGIQHVSGLRFGGIVSINNINNNNCIKQQNALFSARAKEPYDLSKMGTTTLHKMMEESVAKNGPRPLFGVKKDGKFEYNTYASFGLDVLAARGILKSFGVKKGTHVAIIAANRPEWAASSYAAQGLGGIFVPMYEQQLAKEWEYVISDSGAEVLLVSSHAVLKKLGSHLPETVKHVLCLDDVAAAGGFQAYAKKIGVEPCKSVDDVALSDTASLIYTSGSTGKPKGVVLTHRNIMSNVDGSKILLSPHYDHNDRHLSFLPWAHIYGQSVELHGCVNIGASLACSESRETLPNDLLLSQPTVLVSVPTLFLKVYNGLQKEKPKAGIKLAIFNWAFSVARERRDALNEGKTMGPLLTFKWNLATKIVFSKIHARLGGRLRHATSGGAALDPDIQNFFCDIGIPVFEGYGLTETSPIVLVERYGLTEQLQGGLQPHPGSTIYICPPEKQCTPGEPVPELADGVEGELCVSGPGVMAGYYKNPSATEEVFFELNGAKLFRTGDLAILENGVVRITGRVKELFKLQNGKYVAPAPIENSFQKSNFINQSMVYGANRPYVIAVIVPNMEYLAEALHADPETVLETHSVEAHRLIRAEVELRTQHIQLKSYERPVDVLLLPTPFTVESGMVTQKGNLKRGPVTKLLQKEIDEVYQRQNKA